MASEWKIKVNGALIRFLWIIFPSLNRDENKAIGALSDSGFKAAAWTLENKTGNVHISSKLNPAFSTIGKVTADKITAKLEGKTHAFALVWIIISNTRSYSESRLWNFDFFFLLDKFFFASSCMKIYCYWTSCHVFIWLPSFERFSARWIWISVHLIYGDPRDLFV